MDAELCESDLKNSNKCGIREYQEETEFEYGGKAQRILSSLDESIQKIDDFLSGERGFMLGDVVSSIIKDPSGQMGKVVDVDMCVDLENFHGFRIRDVNSKKILKIRSISEGDYVIHGPWFGKVNKVVDRVTILFDDGEKCEVIPVDQDAITPISPSLFVDSPFLYYPGQRVKLKISSVSKPFTWLCGNSEENQNEGTVCAVEAGLIHVSWLASASAASCQSFHAPPSCQDSKNLTVLSCFSHGLWQVDDWCTCPVTKSPNVCLNEIFVISRIKTKVDVLWQDGSRSTGLDSKSLYVVNIVNHHEFWPEQFVLDQFSLYDDDSCIYNDQRWGVVKSMNSKERTVQVVWRNILSNPASEMQELEEIVSAYEVVGHPDYAFCLGDVVFWIETNRFMDHEDEQSYSKCDEAASQDKFCCCDQNGCTCYLSRIGYVIGFEDGSIKVRWASGETNEVAPYEIFLVNDHSSSVPVLFEEKVQSTGHINQKGELDINGAVEECDNGDPWACCSLFLPPASIGFCTDITAFLFCDCGSTSQSSSLSSVNLSKLKLQISLNEDVPESSHHSTEEQPLVNDLHINTCENKILPFESVGDKPKHFKQFDMVSDCQDHHFKGLTSFQVKRDWQKKIQQEWNILDKNLPGTIYVRVYEERMDLLRAAIVGAHETPYHDGLFFFDIALPAAYPHEPPLVHYNSGGLRLNPNLYESGKVCLSLLNTWTGMGSEAWNPGGSTILQVLLSLQALVLNEKPYFNEAGYEQQVGKADGEKNSLSYNENAFLVTCKSMLHVLHKPPKHFEELVEEHFAWRSHDILSACRAHLRAAPAGDASGRSTGFKITLSKLLPKLEEVFPRRELVSIPFLGVESQ